MASNRNLLVLPGDGIGPEVMNEVRKIIAWMGKKRAVGFDIKEDVVGGAALDKHGVPLSDDAMKTALEADGARFGDVPLDVSTRAQRTLAGLTLKLVSSSRSKRLVAANPATFSWPIDPVVVTSPWGDRLHPVHGEYRFHAGVDLEAGRTQPVYAAAPGVVAFAGWNQGHGKQVELQHDAHVSTRYSHLSSWAVQPGELVKRGDVIGWAGKTGTAQKADPVARGYSDKHFASFIGMLPAEDPRVVIAIFIDEPKTDIYGGLVAAPAFKEIAEVAMPHLAVPPSRVVPVHEVASKPEPAPKPEKSAVVAAIERLDTVTEGPAEGAVRVPDLTGQPGRSAVSQALTAALEPRLIGSGRVVAQTPAAGSLVEKGARITLELAGNLPSVTR